MIGYPNKQTDRQTEISTYIGLKENFKYMNEIVWTLYHYAGNPESIIMNPDLSG